MLIELGYDRRKAREYARRWAYGRNPLFYNFTGIGGDCTNFISQCLLAGCCTMNCKNTFGWYYNSASDRTPSWTGVQYLYDFLTRNEGAGPYARDADINELVTGDLVQLADRGGRFYHTLLITGARRGTYLVAAHSFDTFDRPLVSYSYARLRPLKLLGCRGAARPAPDCFSNLLNAIAIPGRCPAGGLSPR